VLGCGDTKLLRQHEDFVFLPETLNEDRIIRLYERGRGILRQAAEIPTQAEEATATIR